MNDDDLNNNIDIKKLKEVMKVYDEIYVLQEKIQNGGKISEREVKSIATKLQTSVKDIKRILGGEEINIPSLNYFADESTSTEVHTPPKKTKKQIKKTKEIEKKEDIDLQEEFDYLDNKYQEMMNRGNLTDNEIIEIGEFYHIDEDEIKLQLKENRQENNSNYSSEVRTYAKDKEKKQKRRGLFKKR